MSCSDTFLRSLGGLFNLRFVFDTKPLSGIICSFSGTPHSFGVDVLYSVSEKLKKISETVGKSLDGFWMFLALSGKGFSNFNHRSGDCWHRS